ncbi:hypothetical protein DXT77_09265 [Pseudomonas sp. 91RF]|jgi:hypothetical protein|uniref:hypothetical protein n=1 Tax=Pseudomonas sp. 91RF TaxID=2292261 RepID=UPI000E66DD2D|nr:hypothetical protein [Pseudomonas sp. 91RF]RIJ11197.1 hypothetical protein DXT77_09265 [Pseudomonas sp. 91RF]
MFLRKARNGIAIAIIASVYSLAAHATSVALQEHQTAVLAVATTQACAKKHPDAGISLERFLEQEKGNLTEPMTNHIREVADKPMYASEVKSSVEFFNSPGGENLLESLCKGMVITK